MAALKRWEALPPLHRAAVIVDYIPDLGHRPCAAIDLGLTTARSTLPLCTPTP
jgi:hypothetical protein